MPDESPPPHAAGATVNPSHARSKTLHDSKGWDGKLRVDRSGEASDGGDGPSEPETENQDVEVPGQQIDADDDLLDDYPLDTTEIDLVHCRIRSILLLRLERFAKVENSIRTIESLDALGSTLTDLDLYDNVISRIKGLENLPKLTSLDLSFNKIKHVRRLDHLKDLVNVYFVQNSISRIDGFQGLTKLKNLELGDNRIRNLSSLSNLRILSIQSNRISKIQDLEGLVNLEELYVSHNALTEISGLDHNTKLHVIDVSNNRISQLDGLAHLNELEELWASNNQLASFDEVERQLAHIESLQTVYFEGNPLQKTNAVLYRNKVRLALPKVKQIDATFVKVS
ncbi:MAG: hypothetical protein M1815_003293 [Lichina confinis]|nr:MAG: hypothetical protein M1815_003293 [Lichina confinis]